MLVARYAGEGRIEAQFADYNRRFECPGCGAEVILKRGRVVVAHFAHKTLGACPWGAGETLAHLAAKNALRNAFAARGWPVELECVMPALHGPDRRIDVLTWIDGVPLAVELQHSGIGLYELEARAHSYARHGLAQLWIPFVRRRALEDSHVEEESPVWRTGYGFNVWERWIRGHGFGKCVLYDPVSHGLYWSGSFWMKRELRIRLQEPCYRVEGDKLVPADDMRLHVLTAQPVDLACLKFRFAKRGAFTTARYTWPAGLVGQVYW